MTKKTISIPAILLLFTAAFFVFSDEEESTISLDATTAATPATAPANPANTRKAFVIPVSGPVDHGLAAFVGRAIREAGNNSDNTLVILDIDTFGGQVDAAFAIVDSITSCAAPTIAFVRSKAISAGALIALAANRLVMRPNTTIGDVAPLINTNDGPKMLGEKHQSPIRAKFRTLAHKNGFPEILSEAMVTEGPGVFEVTLPDTVIYLDSARIVELDPLIKRQIQSIKLIVRPGELLTMTEIEALQYGFSTMTVSTIEEMLHEMGYVNVEIIKISRNWSERFVSIIAMLAPVLMMIGFSALYIEIRTPGFGVPGTIGIVCLALVFFGQYMVGLAHYTEMLLLITGAVLLAIEIFVLPGFGVIGISGIILMMIGMVLSFQNFVIPSPEFPWQVAVLKKNILRLSVSLLGSIVLILLFFRYFFELVGRVVKGPYLAATLGGAQSDEGMSFVPKVGDMGVASTSLRPSGKVLIGKNTCDVVTEGQFINSGTPVVVVLIQGNRIVVGAETCA
jgi:membrane-bound serine protease (ClpP class)